MIGEFIKEAFRDLKINTGSALGLLSIAGLAVLRLTHVTKPECALYKEKLEKRLTNGDVAFAHIEEQLKPIPDMKKSIRRIELTMVRISERMKIPIPEDDNG